MKKISLLLVLMVSLVGYTMAQRTISGTITDGSGEPLIGASVIGQGTTLGTITDIDGTYSFNIDESVNVLVVSYTGFETKTIPLGASNLVDISLSEGAVLDEVVVIGFSAQKRKDLTGSVSGIKLDDFSDVTLPSAQIALQGSTAGVQVTKSSGTPGGGIDVRVRGTTSINASSQPLFIVDGVPIISDDVDFTQVGVGNAQLSNLADLNPNEIESMEVLKDAASAAIYGSRGANGVVLITTKKGKEGKAKVSLNASTGTQETINRIDVVDGPDYIDYITQVFGANIVGTEANVNWQDEIFQGGIISEAGLSVSGGTKETKYFASLGFTNDEGIIVGSRFQRYSARLNLDQKINNRITMGLNMGYTNSITDQVQNDNNIFGALSSAILLPPVVPIFNEDGSFGSAFGLENPVAATTQYDNTVTRNRLQGRVFGKVRILDQLSFTSSFGTDLLQQNESVFEPRVLQSSATGIAVDANVRNVRFVNDNYLQYVWGNTDHDVTVTGGVSFQEDRIFFGLAETSDFPTDQFTGLTSGALPLTTSGSFSGDNLRSFFGNVNYSFLGKYFITASVRRDGSSRFVNERFGTFPGVSAAWRASNESFIQGNILSDLKLRANWGRTGNNNVGNFGALQLFDGGANFQDSPGTFPSQIGNPDLRWETTTSYGAGIDFGLFNDKVYGSIDYYRKNTTDLLLNRPIPTTSGFGTVLENVGEVENIGWEFDVGYTIIDNDDLKWNVSVIAAYNENEVIRLVDGIPFDLGFASRVAEGQPLGSFFGHVTDGIFQNEQEIEDAAFQTNDTAPGDIRFLDIGGGAGPDGIVGTGDDLPPDGIINDDDRTFLGSAVPDWTGGFRTNVSYFGFDLSLFFQFATGGQIYNNNLAFAEGLQSVFAPTQNAFDNTWTEEGQDTDIPRIVNGDPNGNRRDSDRFVEDGGYLRLKNISLGYKIPTQILEKVGISKARIYVSGYNLLTLTDYSWFDPEVSTFDVTNGSGGTDFLTFPQPRQVLVGINLDF